jgi:hypothetical protein
MVEIFEKKERTRTEPKKQGEGDFVFYDSSARPEYDAYRALVNDWLAEMPDQGRGGQVCYHRCPQTKRILGHTGGPQASQRERRSPFAKAAPMGSEGGAMAADPCSKPLGRTPVA